MNTNRTENRTRRHTPAALRISLRAALAAVSDAPAVVFTDRLDIGGTNPVGQALLAPMLGDDRPNLARFVSLDEEALSAFHPEWDRIADGYINRLLAARESTTLWSGIWN